MDNFFSLNNFFSQDNFFSLDNLFSLDTIFSLDNIFSVDHFFSPDSLFSHPRVTSLMTLFHLGDKCSFYKKRQMKSVISVEGALVSVEPRLSSLCLISGWRYCLIRWRYAQKMKQYVAARPELKQTERNYSRHRLLGTIRTMIMIS